MPPRVNQRNVTVALSTKQCLDTPSADCQINDMYYEVYCAASSLPRGGDCVCHLDDPLRICHVEILNQSPIHHQHAVPSR